MRTVKTTLSILIFFQALIVHGQVTAFRENGKWGMREKNATVVPAVYDTVFGFDPTGRVCLACHRIVTTTNSGFVRVKTTSYLCNYLNRTSQLLVVRNSLGDTSSVYSLGRHAVRQYSNTTDFMTVSASGKRHLVHKDFTQLTFKGYHSIEPVEEADFYRCEFQSESDAVYTGLITKDEKQLIPFRYSSIKVKPADSLIVACSAGFKGTDDIYDYSGKKLLSSGKHIAEVTRDVLVEKHPDEPRKYSVVHRATGKETLIEADEFTLAGSTGVQFRKKKTWYRLDARTGQQLIVKKQ